jgi:hypothetical protein
MIVGEDSIAMGIQAVSKFFQHPNPRHSCPGNPIVQDADDQIPCILEPELTDKAFRRNWARLIQETYEVDPFLFPKSSSEMRVNALIKAPDVIKKILKHLGLWNIKRKLPPRAHVPPIDIIPVDDNM